MVAIWATDNSGCQLQATEVRYQSKIGTLSDASNRIVDQTPVLNGTDGCDEIIRPRTVRDQGLYPTGSRSNYRSIVETRIDESPTDANHLVRIRWLAEGGSFSTLMAVNTDSLQLLFAPIRSLVGSDSGPPEASAQRTDTLGTGSVENQSPTTWTPAGSSGEDLVWRSSVSGDTRTMGRVTVDNPKTLARIAPEKTVEWNPDAAFTSGNCTLGPQGLVTSATLDSGTNTSSTYRQITETDVRVEWQLGQCCVKCVLDVGVGEGNVTLSSSETADGFGSDISKSGTGQFWSFRRTYSWCITE